MGAKQIREKYKGDTRTALNRAIRAELPGGDATLNALSHFHDLCNGIDFDTADKTARAVYNVAQVAHDRLSAIRDLMVEEIQKRYT